MQPSAGRIPLRQTVKKRLAQSWATVDLGKAVQEHIVMLVIEDRQTRLNCLGYQLSVWGSLGIRDRQWIGAEPQVQGRPRLLFTRDLLRDYCGDFNVVAEHHWTESPYGVQIGTMVGSHAIDKVVADAAVPADGGSDGSYHNSVVRILEPQAVVEHEGTQPVHLGLVQSIHEDLVVTQPTFEAGR